MITTTVAAAVDTDTGEDIEAVERITTTVTTGAGVKATVRDHQAWRRG